MLNYKIVDINSRAIKTNELQLHSAVFLDTKNSDDPNKFYPLTPINPVTIFNIISKDIADNNTNVYNLCRTLRPVYSKFLCRKEFNGMFFEDHLRELKKSHPDKVLNINHCMDLLGCKKLILDANNQEINPLDPNFDEKLQKTDNIYLEGNKNGESKNIEITPAVALQLIESKIEEDPLSCVNLCDTLSPFYDKFLSNGEFLKGLEQLKIKKPNVAEEIDLCKATLKVPEKINTTQSLKEQNVQEDLKKDYFQEVKELFEKYDIQRDGQIVNIVDRQTGQIFNGNIKEFTTAVQFAHSWVNAAGFNVSKSSQINEYGIDSNQYDLAFSYEAKQTFENIMKEYWRVQSPESIDVDKFAASIKDKTGYKYADSIVKGLLLNPQGQSRTNPEFDNGFPFKEDWQQSCIYRQLKIYSNLSMNRNRESNNTSDLSGIQSNNQENPDIKIPETDKPDEKPEKTLEDFEREREEMER